MWNLSRVTKLLMWSLLMAESASPSKITVPARVTKLLMWPLLTVESASPSKMTVKIGSKDPIADKIIVQGINRYPDSFMNLIGYGSIVQGPNYSLSFF